MDNLQYVEQLLRSKLTEKRQEEAALAKQAEKYAAYVAKQVVNLNHAAKKKREHVEKKALQIAGIELALRKLGMQSHG